MAKPPASGPAGASSERSRRWNSASRSPSGTAEGASSGGASSTAGSRSTARRIAGHVRGDGAARAGLVRPRSARAHQRQHVEVEEILHRALGGRVEEAQRLDLVAEELQAHRPLARGREDVDDAAAEAPLPDLHDRLHALVARGFEPGGERLALHRAAQLQAQQARAIVRGLEQRRGQRGRRGHHHHGLAAQQAMAHQRAHRVLLAVPVAPPAPALRRRELEHPARALPGPAEASRKIGHVLGGLVDLGMPGGDDHDGALGDAREAGDDQAARMSPRARGPPDAALPGRGRRRGP